MTTMKRCVHIDFHNMPGIRNFAEGIHATKIAQMLQDANVTYVNIFARCNIGFSYYPTRIGTVYPGLQRDLLGEMIEACHERNIGVTAYLNGGLNHELMLRNPQWLRVNKDGSTQDDNTQSNFFRTPCMNSGYVDYLLEEIQEVIDKKPDGIFIDCLLPKRCYCQRCMGKMEAAGVNIEDEQAVLRFAADRMEQVARQIRKLVPQNMRLFFNSFPYDRIADCCTQAELECLPTDTQIWGYDYFIREAPYYRMFSQDRVYMTGRFVDSWGDYGGYRNYASLENDVFDALMYGFAPSVGDHMDPVTGLDPTLYNEIGNIFSHVKDLEPYLDGAQPLTEAAILRNKSIYGNPNLESVTGAAKFLSDKKICFDIINEDMSFDGYELLVLPDGLCMTNHLKDKLNSFSGSILSCGKSLDTQGRWDFISHVENDENQDGFFPQGTRSVAMYFPSIKMKSTFSHANYIAPRFKRGFDGRHSYFYIPPGEITEFSAIAQNGKTTHVCFDIFRTYCKLDAQYLFTTLSELTDALLPAPILDGSKLPTLFRATMMRGNSDILQIKSTFPALWGKTGTIPEHIIVAEGLQIGIKGAYRSAQTIPEKKDLNIQISNDRTWIALDKLTGYTAIELIKEN